MMVALVLLVLIVVVIVLFSDRGELHNVEWKCAGGELAKIG